MHVAKHHIYVYLGEGPSFDYTVDTNQVRALFQRPDPPDSVVFTFNVDGIAQEDNETFQLMLDSTITADLSNRNGVFFRKYLNLTIVDSDSNTTL